MYKPVCELEVGDVFTLMDGLSLIYTGNNWAAALFTGEVDDETVPAGAGVKMPEDMCVKVEGRFDQDFGLVQSEQSSTKDVKVKELQPDSIFDFLTGSRLAS